MLRADGRKFESTTLAPSGKALAYGTADGVYVAAIPDNCAPGGPGTLRAARRAKSPDWGPADVPAASAFDAHAGDDAAARRQAGSPRASSSSRSTRTGKVTVTRHHGRAGKVKVTAKRKRRTVASLSKTAKAAGQADLQAQGPRQADGQATFAGQTVADGAPRVTGSRHPRP